MRWLIALTILVGSLGLNSRLPAGESEVCCPQCHYVCKFSVEKEKVKKYCWQTECKPICIPKVTFPWQNCCAPKCARVKHVSVLKKHEYECEKCKYKFTPECLGCGCVVEKCTCGNGRGGGSGRVCDCTNGSSCDACAGEEASGQ